MRDEREGDWQHQLQLSYLVIRELSFALNQTQIRAFPRFLRALHFIIFNVIQLLYILYTLRSYDGLWQRHIIPFSFYWMENYYVERSVTKH